MRVAGNLTNRGSRCAASLLMASLCALVLSGSAQAAKVAIGSFGEQGTTGGKLEGATSSPRTIAVNPATGDVYAADTGNNRIQQFDSAGNWIRAWGWDVAGPAAPAAEQASETDSLTVNATGGKFILKFGSGGPGISETGEISATASAGEVEAALNAITNVSTGGGSVSVTGGPGNAGGTLPYLVVFNGGPLKGTNVGALTAASAISPNQLSGGTASVAVASVNEGTIGFEVCQTAANCQKGASSNAAGAISEPKAV